MVRIPVATAAVLTLAAAVAGQQQPVNNSTLSQYPQYSTGIPTTLAALDTRGRGSPGNGGGGNGGNNGGNGATKATTAKTTTKSKKPKSSKTGDCKNPDTTTVQPSVFTSGSLTYTQAPPPTTGTATETETTTADACLVTETANQANMNDNFVGGVYKKITGGSKKGKRNKRKL